MSGQERKPRISGGGWAGVVEGFWGARSARLERSHGSSRFSFFPGRASLPVFRTYVHGSAGGARGGVVTGARPSSHAGGSERGEAGGGERKPRRSGGGMTPQKPDGEGSGLHGRGRALLSSNGQAHRGTSLFSRTAGEGRGGLLERPLEAARGRSTRLQEGGPPDRRRTGKEGTSGESRASGEGEEERKPRRSGMGREREGAAAARGFLIPDPGVEVRGRVRVVRRALR